MRSGATTGWSGGISRRRFGQRIQGLHGEHRGKPYAGNPHVRFDEGLLARAFTRRAGVYSTRFTDGGRDHGLVLRSVVAYAGRRAHRWRAGAVATTRPVPRWLQRLLHAAA